MGGPWNIGDLSLINVGLKDLERKVRRAVVVDDEMFGAHHQIEFEPFPKPLAFVFEQGCYREETQI